MLHLADDYPCPRGNYVTTPLRHCPCLQLVMKSVGMGAVILDGAVIGKQSSSVRRRW